MTTAGTTVPTRATIVSGRILRHYAVSRGIPPAVLLLAACAIGLGLVLHWNPPGAGPGARIFPLLMEAGAASIVGVVTRSPLGEPERATGRRLPTMRLAATIALTLIAVGILAAGAATGRLQFGCLGLARDVAGMTGLALILAAVAGGTKSWLGPLSFWIVSAYAINERWTTPWLWPDRPPHDRGAAVCAALAFVIGTCLITVRGARDSVNE